jgi:hypothetical protein
VRQATIQQPLLSSDSTNNHLSMAMAFCNDHDKRSVSTATKSSCGQTSSTCELLWLHQQPAGNQLNDQDMGPILEEAETRQRPEWEDIADCSPMYKSYCAQWKSHAVTSGTLEHFRESTDNQK